jgi:hypothetical protein
MSAPTMTTEGAPAVDFDAIYATDLVYAPGCWQLCGDAHCCTFSRYKSQMKILGHRHKQELPLLPGESDYMKQRGILGDFRDAQCMAVEYPLSQGKMKLEFLVGGTNACACKHDTRTTVCRLYPLLPIFDIDGKLTGVDADFGIYEEIEKIDGTDRGCKLTNVPFSEMNKLLTIASAIGRSPKAVFYVTAYQLAKQHARTQLQKAKTAQKPERQMSTLALFEGMFLLRQLLDQSVLRPQLEALAARFRDRHGARFSLD